MKKLNMNLTAEDENRIDKLKEKYGLINSSEVIRFLIKKEVDE